MRRDGARAPCGLLRRRHVFPVMDGSLDGVMSMFALTIPDEFHRVLSPGGYYLEVTAGREHLMALKELIYPEITEKQEKKKPEGIPRLPAGAGGNAWSLIFHSGSIRRLCSC